MTLLGTGFPEVPSTLPRLTIREAALAANANARQKGFWDGNSHSGLDLVTEKLLLIVSEVSECTEILRETREGLAEEWTSGDSGKPEGFVYELADIIIRTLDIAAHFNLDIEEAVAKKMIYNRTRPHKHGKNF